MKRLSLWILLANAVLAGEPPGWMSAREIERLNVTIALAEYPLGESSAKHVLGLPAMMPLVIGGGRGVHGAPYLISALSDPDDSKGFYAIRFQFAASPMPPSAYILRSGVAENREEPERMITAIDLLFWSVSPDLTFKVERRESPEVIEALRARMKATKLSPLEFSREWMTPVSETQKGRPNQSLQRSAGSRPSSGDSPASETPSSLGPRG